MNRTLMTLVILTLATLPLSAQMSRKEYVEAKRAEAKAIREANRLAVTEWNKLRSEMVAMGMKAEIKECEKILAKCLEPDKRVGGGGGSTPWPGEENYARLLDRFGEVGGKLSTAYAQVASVTPDEKLEESYQILSDWLGTFPSLAQRMAHFNKRRKECKMGPVTLSWTSSIGGFMHGRYLSMNRGHPSTAGLGAHNENSKLPGYSPEGAAAARGIGGSGWFDGWMGSAFHRQPVFNPRCGRISFGGFKGSHWCKQIAGGNKPQGDLLTWPGDGASGIRGVFGGEAPDPLPKGVRSAGTMIVIKYLKGKPKNFTWRLLRPDGSQITDFIEIDKKDANAVFCPRQHLSGGTYKLELLGVAYKKVITFTVGGGGGPGYGRRITRRDPGAGGRKPPTGNKTPRRPAKLPDKPAISGSDNDERVPLVRKPRRRKKHALLVAIAAALATKPRTPARGNAIARVKTAWALAKTARKEAALKRYGVNPLIGLGLDQHELTQLHQHSKGVVKPPAKRYRPIRKGEEPPEYEGPKKRLGLGKAIDAAIGAKTDALRKTTRAAFTKAWSDASLDEKLDALEKHGKEKLLGLGVSKREIKELADF